MSAGVQHMSESVFRGMCLIVGTSQQVAIRRETTDIEDMVLRQVVKNNDSIASMMLSGSRREGFSFETSDFDIMIWLNICRVVTNASQLERYDSPTAIFLSDDSESPPGFTLLQLPPGMNNDLYDFLRPFLVRMGDTYYVSCSGIKEMQLLAIYSRNGIILTVHGPCTSIAREGIKFDLAFCISCDFWPQSAFSWIDRCQSWPGPEVVNGIIRGGCHFVAIGHPLGQHEHLEWRISFSQAEQKCVYAMTHCQFLTYGLLKIFLKEVINHHLEETNELLCSYHIKTAVFWTIQQNILPQWCPQNLLDGFWICFKLLLKWVYEGVCPNFFIPQNNLFLSKIYGSAQKRLFLQLQGLYKQGLTCLLQCSSIRSYIIDALFSPRLSICTDESVMKLESDLDKELFNAIKTTFFLLECIVRQVKILNAVEKLIDSHLTQYQAVHLQKFTVNCLQNTAATVVHKMYNNSFFNKQMYIADRLACRLLKLAAKFGCVSDLLYLAMFYHKTSRYRKALSLIETAKAKLEQPYLMYNEHMDAYKYIEAVGGMSWSTKMREAVACDIKLHQLENFISEIVPIQQFAQTHELDNDIPLFVFLHFLEFLLYRHIDSTKSQDALNDLKVLIQHGHYPYISKTSRKISSKILEICQQMADL